MRKTLAFAVTAVFGALGLAQKTADSPEPVIRALVRAMYSNNAAEFKRLTVANPRIGLLTTGGSVNQDGLRELSEDPGGLQIIMKRPFEYQGKTAKPDAAGRYPVGTTALYVVAHHRSPMVMVLQRQSDGWKVDPRWWIGMVDLATGPEPKQGTPSYAARAILSALIAMDRKAVARYAVPGASLDLLFAGAPSQREPSGVLDAAALEMPIIEMLPSEFRVMPTGNIVHGSTQAGVSVLLGLMGPVEVPFVVRMVGAEWRVEAQPYFALINQ